MRVIVSGSRDFSDYNFVKTHLDEILKTIPCDEIVSGGCRGVDALGEMYANQHGITLKTIRADWDAYGKAAGPIRNKQLAMYGDYLIAFPGHGPGTRDMINAARYLGIPVKIIPIS